MKINNYEILLKRIKKYESRGVIVNFIGALLLGLSLVWAFIMGYIIDMAEVSGYGVYGMLFLLVFVGILLSTLGCLISDKSEPLKNAYVNEYRNDIVTKNLNDIFDSVEYNCDRGFPRQSIEDRDILGFPVITNGNFSSRNYIHASYKGIFWKYGDIRIWKGRRDSRKPGILIFWITRESEPPRHVLFDARVLEIDYPILCTTRLKIYSHSFPNVKGGWTSSKKEKRQETGDKNFDRRFLVKCNSDVDFRNVVTPEMKEKLELFHNLYSGFAIEIERGKLYILVERAGESLVPDYSQKMDVVYETKRIKRDTQVITDAIDIFCRKLC